MNHNRRSSITLYLYIIELVKTKENEYLKTPGNFSRDNKKSL